jgi:hypothetical protein
MGKIIDKLQKAIKTKIIHINKMCKNKWIGSNFNFKNDLDHYMFYYKFDNQIVQHTSPSKTIQQKLYEEIKSFQGERTINMSLHVKDVQA